MSKLQVARSVLHSAAARALGRVPPARSSNPFATHVPILVAIGCLLPVRRVLELGSGRYSTDLFLNRASFPALTKLVSLETDPEWAAQVECRHEREARLDLRVVTPPMADAIRRRDIADVDLIFIDDSTDAASRCATISTVAQMVENNQLVVIHDFELREYQDAAKSFAWKHCFLTSNPATGVTAHAEPAWSSKLRAVDRLLRTHLPGADIADASAWIDIFSPMRGAGAKVAR